MVCSLFILPLVGVQRLPADQRPPAGDVLHATAVRDHALLSHHGVKLRGVELGEAVFLGDMDLRGEQ